MIIETIENLEAMTSLAGKQHLKTALILASIFMKGHAIYAGSYPSGCEECERSSTYAEHLADWLVETAEALLPE